MKTVAIATVSALTFAGAAVADCLEDQNQPNSPAYMAGFSQTDLAQSFQHQNSDNICGAGIFLQPGIGSQDTVVIELWDALPTQGGSVLASGSETGTAGQWVDVFWDATAIEPGTTYYLVFSGNVTLGIAGDTANPYPFGQVYANSGFGSWPNFDYTFRTYSDESAGLSLAVNGSCPGTMSLDVTGATPNGNVAFIYAFGTGSQIIPNNLPCAGTELGLNATATLLGTATADANGAASFSGNAPAAACGRVFVQALDLTGCTTTNVEGL